MAGKKLQASEIQESFIGNAKRKSKDHFGFWHPWRYLRKNEKGFNCFSLVWWNVPRLILDHPEMIDKIINFSS